MKEEQKVFGRYLIQKFLGSGATSEVHLARDSKLDRQVALKILKPTLVSDQSSFERFTREAQAASQLFHDHIATVLDMGEVEGRYYIAMRYVDGVSLDKYLQEHGPLSWEQVKKLASQVGSAISFAHQNHYLHRDIKPNNIMITTKGDFVLTDFGLTRAMHESGLTSTVSAVMGTPPYIPPEIWNGKGATHYSDQYSFACVIDEAITGRMLFAGETPQEIITKHLVNKPVLEGYTREIPENVRYILQKALSKESSDRFGSVDEFVAALDYPKEFNVQAYLSQLEEKNRSQADKELLEKLKKKKRRKACVVSILFMSLIVIIACGVGFLFYRDRIPARAFELVGLEHLASGASALMVGDLDSLVDVEELEDPQEGNPIDQSLILDYTQTPTYTMTATLTPTLEPTETLTQTPNPTATNTVTPSATSTPTQVIPAGEYEQIPLGSGVEINLVDSATTELVVYLYRGDGTPITSKTVRVHTQKQDLTGKWVTDQSVGSGRTNNAGAITFNLEPGEYIVGTSFDGYNWGSAGDVAGQASVPVQRGKQTQMVLRLGRINVGFIFGNDLVVTSKTVRVHTQELNLSNQWVTRSSCGSGRTDNAGMITFDLPAGNYIVESNFDGYNWGNAANVKGMANLPLKPGQETQLIVKLSRLVIELKDSSGQPIVNKTVRVYFQEEDVSGNPARGQSVSYGRTGNTGAITFNLTPGTYAFEFDGKMFYNIELQPGKTTITDGRTQTIN